MVVTWENGVRCPGPHTAPLNSGKCLRAELISEKKGRDLKHKYSGGRICESLALNARD